MFTHHAPHLLRIQIGIRHLDTDGLQALLAGVNITVAHGLGQMDVDRLCDLRHIPVHSFDFVNGNSAVLIRQDTVRPALHPYAVFRVFPADRQAHLGPVAAAHAPLQFSVEPPALLHGFHIRSPALPVIQVAAAENKFHQITDR